MAADFGTIDLNSLFNNSQSIDFDVFNDMYANDVDVSQSIEFDVDYFLGLDVNDLDFETFIGILGPDMASEYKDVLRTSLGGEAQYQSFVNLMDLMFDLTADAIECVPKALQVQDNPFTKCTHSLTFMTTWDVASTTSNYFPDLISCMDEIQETDASCSRFIGGMMAFADGDGPFVSILDDLDSIYGDSTIGAFVTEFERSVARYEVANNVVIGDPAVRAEMAANLDAAGTATSLTPFLGVSVLATMASYFGLV